jgi:hypothetical protein
MEMDGAADPRREDTRTSASFDSYEREKEPLVGGTNTRGNVPHGQEAGGEELRVGRVTVGGNTTVIFGKAGRHLGGCNYGYTGREIGTTSCEVLSLAPPTAVPSFTGDDGPAKKKIKNGGGSRGEDDGGGEDDSGAGEDDAASWFQW